MPRIGFGPSFTDSEPSKISGPATPAAPTNTSLPQIFTTATPRVGDSYTVLPGAWSGYPAPTYTFQKKRDGVNVGSPQAGATYTDVFVSADVGTVISFEVEATNTEGSDTAESAGTAAILAAFAAPANTVLPTIAANPRVGASSAISRGTWTGNPTPSLSSVVERNGTSIPLSTGTSYTPVADDAGTSLSVFVTAENSQGIAYAESAGSALVTMGPQNVTPPSITGTARVGETLTRVVGTYLGYPAPSLSGQWKRNGVNISSATNSTYVLVTADLGATITYAETATDSIDPITTTSAGTAAVAAAFTAPTMALTAGLTVATNPSNGTVVGTVAATNTPNPAATYSMTGETTGFAINSSTGQITVTNGTLVDANLDTSRVITVTATNAQGSASTELVITITAASNLVAWTPAMLGSSLKAWYDVTDAGSIISSGGRISQWSDKSGNGWHATQGTATRQPYLGQTQLNSTYNLVCFDATTTSADRQGLQTASGVYSVFDSYCLFWFGRLRTTAGMASNSAILVGIGNSAGTIWQASSGNDTVYAYGNTITPSIETDDAERLRMFALNLKRVSTGGPGGTFRVNGDETEVTSNANPSGGNIVMTIGNTTNFSLPADCDVGLIVAASYLSTANIQRLEGYAAHMAGAEGLALLPAGHPYKSQPPRVPAGTTTTADWIEPDYTTFGERQTYHGSMIEIQARVFDVDGLSYSQESALAGGIPKDLVPSERTRLATDVLGRGYGYRMIRWVAGLHQQGRETSDQKRILSHFTPSPVAGSDQVIDDEDQIELLVELCEATGKTMEVNYQYWGSAGYWKANGTIAGSSALDYPDPVSDPTGYADWIDKFSDAMVADMQEVDAAGLKIVMFSMFNEWGNTAGATYPHNVRNNTTDDDVYGDLWEAMDTKIAAAAWTNTTSAEIKFNANSWNGPSGTSSGVVKALSCYATRFSTWSNHDITDMGTDANNWTTFSAAVRAGLPVMNDEFEYFDAVRNAKVATLGADAEKWMLANSALVFVRSLERNDAEWHMMMIHLGKPTHDSGDVLGYPLVIWKSPDYPDNNTGDSSYDSLQAGYFTVRPTNAHHVFMVHDNLPWDSVRYNVDNFSLIGTNAGVLAFKTPDDRKVIFLVNRANTSKTFRFFCGYDTIMLGYLYDIDEDGLFLASANGFVEATVPAYSMHAWVESDVVDTTPPTILTSGTQTVAENVAFSVTLTANETVTWSIFGGADQAWFSITSGNVLGMAAKNYENALDANADNGYVVIVRATDTSGNTSDLTMTVTVTDVVEDTTPPVISTNAAQTVEEGTELEITLLANETVTWSIVGGVDQAEFSLAGDILTLPAQDYDAPADSDANNTYIVQVRATDLAGNTSDLTITVTVTELVVVNEAPTDITLGSSTTTDAAVAGDLIGILTTTDPNVGDTFTYSFVAPNSHASNKVALDGDRLEVGSAAPLSAGTFAITIRTTDAGGLTYDKNFTITVTAAAAADVPIVVITPQAGI